MVLFTHTYFVDHAQIIINHLICVNVKIFSIGWIAYKWPIVLTWKHNESWMKCAWIVDKICHRLIAIKRKIWSIQSCEILSIQCSKSKWYVDLENYYSKNCPKWNGSLSSLNFCSANGQNWRLTILMCLFRFESLYLLCRWNIGVCDQMNWYWKSWIVL